MKIISLISLFGVLLSANVVDDYLNKNYEKICNFTTLKKYRKNEKIVSIIGDACVKSDNLFLLPFAVHKLKNTSIGRKNAIYFLTIYMKKKLVLAYVFDNFPIDGFELPQTDGFISYIYEKLRNKQFTKDKNQIVIKDKNSTHLIYIKKQRVYIDTYKGKKLIKSRWYK